MARSRAAIGCFGVIALVVALVIVAVTVALFQGQHTPRGNPEYVALGSSFAAGAGLGKLEPGSPLLCARSVDGYPQQLARMRGLSIVDMTCGGAVTKNLLRGGQFFQGPQIRVVTVDTRLVTVTVGGNDIGYIGDLSLLAGRKDKTVFGWLTRTFWKGPKPLAERDFTGLQRELEATLTAVRAQAPNAAVVVATYPAILPQTGTCDLLGLTEAEADDMRQVAAQLAATTRAAAEKAGAMLVDMQTIGADHNAWAQAPWVRGWREAGAAPFHPTLLGAKATAEAIAAGMQVPTTPSR